MLSARLVRWLRLRQLKTAPGVSDRAIALTFGARFVDEVTSGAWLVLAPTFRRAFGLSLVQLGLLSQVLAWVALVVEPPTATLIDVAARRRLMAWSAAGLAASMVLMGVAPTYAVLLASFVGFGLASGPLVHTADVVVVESFPDAPERAYTRATFVDTTGALFGPALVALAAATGVSWRVVLVALGIGAAAYAWGVARTPFPPPPGTREPGWRAVGQALRAARSALGNRNVRRAVVVLVCFEAIETAFLLQYVWLNETVGLSEGAVAAWGAGEQVVALVALVGLDRWLSTIAPDRLLRGAATVLGLLPAAWVAAPGLAARVVIAIPIVCAHAVVWPLAKSRSLTVIPELAGSVQALTALTPILPLAVLEAWFAQAVGVGPAMAVTAAAGAAALFAACRRDAIPTT